MLPLEVYPAMWRAVFYWLPFASMVYGPARMLVAPDAALLQHVIVVQGIAIVALIVVVVLVQSAALRRIHSHGG